MVEIECGMRKNSFWLSLNPRTAPKRPRRRPFRRSHPRHPCTRRRVSSGALCGSGAPDAKKRQKPRTGHPPRRRPPLPFVSSLSSSLVSCGFPRSSHCVLRSGVRFPEPLLRTALAVLRSSSRQENRVLLSLRSGAASAACLSVRSDAILSAFRLHDPRRVEFRFPASPSASFPAGSSPARFEVFRPRLPTVSPASAGSVQVWPEGCSASSEVPGLPPGPSLLFRSFAVRFVHGSYLDGFVFSFRSFRPAFACLSGSLRFPVRFVRF